MKIEAMKSYGDNLGGLHGPMEWRGEHHAPYVWMDQHGFGYMADGRRLEEAPCTLDLVQEYIDPESIAEDEAFTRSGNAVSGSASAKKESWFIVISDGMPSLRGCGETRRSAIIDALENHGKYDAGQLSRMNDTEVDALFARDYQNLSVIEVVPK